MLSVINQERWHKFKSIRRAYYALWILTSCFIISIFADFIANEKALFISYKNKIYFPVISFYAGQEFGQPQASVADYIKLKDDASFRREAFAIWPPYPYGPYHSWFDEATVPPNLPSTKHWLGTDRLGRDILARLLYGLRTGMLFALCLTIIMGVLGVIIGGIQGYWGGRVDLLMQRSIEIWSALPFLYVVILLGSLYGRSFLLLIFIIALFNWIGLSYYMRAEFLKGKKQLYIQAAQALGLRRVSIFLRHILPNSLTPLITILPFGLINSITVLTALDFLGFGLQPPTPSWGELLKQGLEVVREFPHLTIITTSLFFIVLLLATLIGEGMREAFDPKGSKK